MTAPSPGLPLATTELGEPRIQTPALSADGIRVRFGGLLALDDAHLEVLPSSIVGLVGPNGAGKTTFFGVLSGLLHPDHGRVWLHGEDVTAMSPQSRARKGLARTFQQPELFMGLTVREHLVLADRVRFSRRRLWLDMVDPRSLLPPSRAETERVDALLELLELTRVATTSVAALPLGLARLVEIGRALATAPRVVLLDEPLSGLDIRASQQLLAVFSKVVGNPDIPVSLLMVEHDVTAVLGLCSRIFVLDFGQLIAEGNAEEIRHNPAVRGAYLGDEAGTGTADSSTCAPSSGGAGSPGSPGRRERS